MPRTKSGPKGKTNRSLTGHAAPAKVKPPAYLAADERAQFLAIAAQIGARWRPGMEFDVESLTYALRDRAQMRAIIAKDGWFIEQRGAKVKHPAYEVMRDLSSEIFKLTTALGLTRRERADRIKDEKPSSQVRKQEVDPLEAALEQQIG